MEQIALQASTIRHAIKKGYGFSYLMDRCHCDKNAVLSRIDQLWSRTPIDHQKIIGSLEKNEAAERARQPKPSAAPPTPRIEPIMKLDIDPSLPLEERLSQLHFEASKRLETKTLVEHRRTELLTQQQELSTNLKTLSTKLVKRRSEIGRLEQDIDHLVAKSQVVSSELTRIDAELELATRHLQSVQNEIDALETVTLALFADGTIDILEELPVDLDETGHETIYSTIAESDAVQDLSLRQLKGLARLIATSRNLDMKHTFIFDIAEAELAFAALQTSGLI